MRIAKNLEHVWYREGNCPSLQLFQIMRMGSYRRVLLGMLGIFCLAFSMVAQGGVNSPFSRYGIGDLKSEDGMHSRLMGGLGTAHLEIHNLNFVNPASFSFLKSAGFDVALDFKNSKISDGERKSSQFSGNLSYIAMGFPLRNPLNEIFSRDEYKFNWGMGFALMPNSEVSYNIVRQDSLDNVGAFTRNFTGRGGSYKAIWANSLKYQDVSVGVSLGYVFGKINLERNIDFTEQFNAYDNQFLTDYSIRALYLKFGLMYKLTLNKVELEDEIGREEPVFINFGFTYKPKTGFSTISDVLNSNLFLVAVASSPIDTAYSAAGLAGNGTFPSELGFGVSYSGGGKLTLGLDYRRTNWSEYQNDASPEKLGDTHRIAFGGSFRPDEQDFTHFFNRVYYKAGFFFEQDPRSVESEQLDGYGINFGLGLPFAWQRKFSNMNIGVTLGKRSVANILRENYATFSLGFTFNDTEWFIKRKFN